MTEQLELFTTPLDVLKAIRRRLAQARAWTKGSYARNAVGGRTSVDDPAAVCWCLVGAVYTETLDPLPVMYCLKNELRRRGATDDTLQWFNDAPSTQHSDVLDVLDAAIARVSR